MFRKRLVASYLALLLMLSMFGVAAVQHHAAASPEQPTKQYRVAEIDANNKVVHSILLDGPVTMANTTPVNTNKVCITGDPDTFAARLTLTGTLTGTNPVFTAVLQSSDDNGVTWTAVGSAFAAINATTTPTGGKERITFADTAGGGINTPVVWGDCFRIQYTFAGSSTVVANVDVSLYAE